MAIAVPVTRDSLLLNFLQLPVTVTDSLRTIIIGVDYAARRYDVPTLYNLLGAYLQGPGLTAAWPNLEAGETVDLTTASLVISQALVNYFADSGSPGITKGGQYSTVPNAIQHNSGATIWAGPSRTVNVITDVEIGDYVKLVNGSGTLETVVTGFTYLSGLPKVLLLRDNLPSTMLGTNYFTVNISEIVPTLALTSGQVTLTSSTAKANAAITTTTTRVTPAKAVVSGTGYSAVYTSYRAARTPDPIGSLYTITDQAQITDQFVGSQYPESGLGFALARALAPQQTPPLILPAVLGMAVPSESQDDWQGIINRVQRRRDWLTLAPLTSNTTIQGLVRTSVTARASIGLDSRAVFANELTLQQTIFSGGATVLVDQSSTSGQNRTVTRDGGAASPFTGALVGDIVTIASVEYTIATVISAQAVTITTPATPGATQTLNNVIHPLSTGEQVDAYGQAAQALASGAFSVIFPPNPTWETVVVDGFLLAAATAGLRGYTMPQQSLRGVIMESGWEVPESSFEFFSYLQVLGEYGCFVFETEDQLDTGGAVVLYANTTDQTSTINAREALVADVDAIRRYLYNIVATNIGQTKITSFALDQLRAQLSGAIAFLQTNTSVAPFGAIVISGFVGTPRQDPAQLDRVIIPITVTISADIESVQLDITVSIAGV